MEGVSCFIMKQLKYLIFSSTMERQKSVLLESLCHKGVALCRLHQMKECKEDSSKEICNASTDDILEIWRSLLKFVDPNDKVL